MDDPNNVDSYHERWLQRTIRDRRIAEVVAVVEEWEQVAHGSGRGPQYQPGVPYIREWAAAYVDARRAAETPSGSTLAR